MNRAGPAVRARRLRADEEARRQAQTNRRRDLREADLPEERIELTDPVLEGSAERTGWEESAKVQWRRGGFVRLITARAKYATPAWPATRSR
jgi:hypothetical protein